MSLLKLFNWWFQWSWFRLARMDSGSHKAWGLLGPVLPMTGWGTNYWGITSTFRMTEWEAK